MAKKIPTAIIEMNTKSLRKLINNRLESIEKIPPMTKDSFLRASGIYYICPREEALCSLEGKERTREITATQARTFMFGRAFEKMFRDDVLGNSGLLVGKWRCTSCGFIPEVVGMPRYPKPTHCPYCLHTQLEYLEEEIESKECRIRGHNDGFVFYNSESKILEMKTVTDFFWKKISKQPFEHHVAQVQVYMYLLKYRKSVIWYFNKNTSSEICHEVDFNPVEAELYLRKGRELKRFFAEGVLPERTCFHGCEREKSCSIADRCKE